MTIWRYIPALLALLCAPALAQKTAPDIVSLTTPLIADISQNAVAIRTSFNGAQLLIFGARNAPGDLVIAVRGPRTRIFLRRKERIAGMWMHVDNRKYNQLPLFYAVTSTHPLSSITSPAVLEALELGPEAVIHAANGTPQEAFDLALNATLRNKHWWQSPFAPITYFGESLFKARIDLPDTLPHGTFTVEVYLFDGGKLTAFQSIPLTVYNTGFDAWITDTARNHGLVYGISSVLLALFVGWLAHRLFHRG